MSLNFLISSTFRLPKQTINEQFALFVFAFVLVFSTLFHVVPPILFPLSSFFLFVADLLVLLAISLN